MNADEIRDYVDRLPMDRIQDFALTEVAVQLAELNDKIEFYCDRWIRELDNK